MLLLYRINTTKGTTDLGYKSLSDRFSNIFFKINLLLSVKSAINYLTPSHEEKIELTAGTKSFYKILSKNQVIPLKLKIIFNQGSTQISLYISSSCERPDVDNADKVILLKSSKMLFSYYGTTAGRKLFNNTYIYFMMESTKNCELSFMANFGTRKIEARNTISYNELDSKSEIFEDEYCWPSSKSMIRHNLILNNIKYPCKIKNKQDAIILKKHRSHIFTLRKIKEQEIRKQKFLISNKRDVNKRFMEILQRKIYNLNNVKLMLKFWVGQIHIYHNAKCIYEKYKELIIKKRNRELIFVLSIKIYVFFKSHMSSENKTFAGRVKRKINW